jgi:tetratricopeptide (TPR) repeat protein
MPRAWNAKYILAGTVALATFLVYLVTLQNDFVGWDDGPYVVENHVIRSFDPTFFRWAFFDFYVSNWHPLTWISHALDYAVWGLNPLGHHLTNILLHALNTFLVVLLIVKLLRVNVSRLSFLTDRNALIAAGTTGVLFGLHPVHVESVAWIAERKDLLCGLFFLLSIMAYAKFARGQGAGVRDQTTEDSGRRPEGDHTDGPSRKNFFLNKHYLFSLGFFILALLSKPMAVTLPVVLLILDWYPLERARSWKALRTALIEKLPFAALSLISSILTILAQRGTIAPLEFVPVSTRLLVALNSLLSYIGKMLWPANLVPFYPYPSNVSLTASEYLLPLVLVAGITAGCILLAKKQKWWLAAWGYYTATLVPVLGIVQVGTQAMADRYTYLPGIGPFLCLGLAAAWIADRTARVQKGRLAAQTFAVAAAVAAIMGLSWLTVEQTGVWKNTIVLWNYVIEKEPDRVPQAYNNRGLALKNRGQMQKAIEDFNRAIALNPEYALAYNNRGVTLKKAGMLQEAIEDFDRAIALNPSYYKAYNNRGSAYGKIGRPDKAVEDFDKAISLNPSYYETYLNRGVMLGEAGMVDKAIESFNQALSGDPNYADAYYNRGFAYSLLGRDDLALADYNKAIGLNRNQAQAYLNRGKLYMKMGQKKLCIADFQRACDLGNQNGCNALQQADAKIAQEVGLPR